MTENPEDLAAEPPATRPRKRLTLGKANVADADPAVQPPESPAMEEAQPLAPAIGTVEPMPVSQTGKAFWLALVAGALAAGCGVLDGPLRYVGVVGPILSIVMFAVYGRSAGWANHGDSRQRFADGAYFLGFILTMLALIIGFLPAGLSEERTLESREVLRHFGMALGATAAGLIARILILQTPSPSRQGLEAELERATAKVTEEAQAIAAQLAVARQAMADANEAALAQQAETVKAMLALIRQELHDALAPIRTGLPGTIDKASQELATAVQGMATQVKEGSNGMAAAAARMQAGFAGAGESAERLASVGSAGVQNLSSLLGALGVALSASTEQTRGVSEAAGAAARSGKQIAEDMRVTANEMARIRTEIVSSVTSVTAMPGELSVAGQQLQEKLSGFGKNLDQSLRGVESRVQDELTSTATALEQALENFRKAVAALDADAP